MGLIKLLENSYKEWVRDRAKFIAASLAYFELLSLAPFVGFILFTSIKILGEEKTRTNVLPVLKNWFTPQFVKVITFMLEKFNDVNQENIRTLSLLAGFVLAWGAMGYIDQLKSAIETTWNKRRDQFGLRATFRRTWDLIKMGSIIILIWLVLVLLRALLPHPYIESTIQEDGIIVLFINLTTQFVLFFVVLLFLFVYATPIKFNWKHALPGATLGGIMYVLGREIMKSQMNANPDMELAEAIIVVLMWFYYSNLVYVYAAEFNKVYLSHKYSIDTNLFTVNSDEKK